MNIRRSAVLCLFSSLALFAASPTKYSYWVAPCPQAASTCQPGDPQLADWALRAWQSASAGAFEFNRVPDSKNARIRIVWASADQGLYGETRPTLIDGKPGAEVYVMPAPFPTSGDQLLRDAIVYLTCLHESGHALGLRHTDAFEDIMYSFQFGGDIPEYFGRYRRKLRVRDDIQKNSGLSEADRNHLLVIFGN